MDRQDFIFSVKHSAQTAALLATLSVAVSANAVDGVQEINAACAAAGCFASDTAGFPVSISASGSYRLTSNLIVGNVNITAVEIEVDNVTLDLNGFSIIGPVTCTGDPVTSCTSSGTGDGVFAISVLRVNTTVRNGTVRGMGDDGISLGKAASVSDVLAFENAGDGISCTSSCTVARSKALRNGNTGIFQAGSPGAPQVSLSSLFRSNVASGNKDRGLQTNDLTSLVSGNVLYGNGTEGLGLIATGGYEGNVIRNNNGGDANPQVSGGIEIGTNLCGANTTCP